MSQRVQVTVQVTAVALQWYSNDGLLHRVHVSVGQLRKLYSVASFGCKRTKNDAFGSSRANALSNAMFTPHISPEPTRITLCMMFGIFVNNGKESWVKCVDATDETDALVKAAIHVNDMDCLQIVVPMFMKSTVQVMMLQPRETFQTLPTAISFANHPFLHHLIHALTRRRHHFYRKNLIVLALPPPPRRLTPKERDSLRHVVLAFIRGRCNDFSFLLEEMERLGVKNNLATILSFCNVCDAELVSTDQELVANRSGDNMITFTTKTTTVTILV